MTVVHTHTKIKPTSWPESRLLPGERHYISISCGNTSIQWALHGTKSGDLNPHFFWRTPHLMQEDVDVADQADLVSALARHLPTQVSDLLFGPKTDQTIQAVEEKNKLRGNLVSFYIVSTNKDQTNLLAKVIGSIPCRMYEMQATDFFSENEGAYAGMGLDRLADLRGALSMHGPPVLVIDGGSALTYTAANAKGHIMGGGISPGVGMRMRALNEFTSALPLVDAEKFVERLRNGAAETRELPTVFAKSTKEAMVYSMLNELSSCARSIATAWKETTGPVSKKRGKDDEKVNSHKIVTVTGGAGLLLKDLLQKDNGGIIKTSASEEVRTQHCNGLIHFGVTWVLDQRSDRVYRAPFIAENPSNKRPKLSEIDPTDYIGKNIAKEFETPDKDGDAIFRGHVISYDDTFDDGPLWRILYTDGDEEDVDLHVLEEMIRLYKIVGDKKVDPRKHPEHFIGKRIAKVFFGKQVYFGNVKSYTEGLWHVEYDDGDSEDFDADDLLKHLKIYEGKRQDDPGL